MGPAHTLTVCTTDNGAYILKLEDLEEEREYTYAYLTANEACAAVIRLMRCSPQEITDYIEGTQL